MKVANKLNGRIDAFIRILLTKISPTLNTKYIFYKSKGKKIDLNNPKTFDEKISWLKLNIYSNNELVSNCADKYKVREYIKEKGFGKILTKLYGAYDYVDEIEWNKFPDKFALKLNVGAGANVICDDKTKLDINQTRYSFDKWMNRKYHLLSSELHYKHIEPKIICEEYIETNNNHAPDDYKIYVFNGKAQYTMLCTERETGSPKFYFFDREWNLARINNDSINAPKYFKKGRPENLEEMYEISETLAAPFPFVRVDLYNVDEKIIFGELTFTPAGGNDANLPEKTDKLFGNLIKLPH